MGKKGNIASQSSNTIKKNIGNYSSFNQKTNIKYKKIIQLITIIQSKI